MSLPTLVLGIESSCDETGVAIYSPDEGIVGEAVFSQIDLHAEYGGVVPELASRDHIRKISILLQDMMAQSGRSLSDLTGLGYTAGPGLIGALLVGACFGRSLAFGLSIPCVEVHHMEAHLLAVMLDDPKPTYPFLALLVSGGHTQLIQANAPADYVLLGETVDDAIGEAFDKTAKLLGLAYPGGPQIEALARKGDEKRYPLSRPMTDRPGLDFSFSGLKTQVVNVWNDSEKNQKVKADLAASFQLAALETLVMKAERAVKQTGINRLVLAGGVSANASLRDKLNKMMKKHSGTTYYPRLEHCADNGVMVAYAAYEALKRGQWLDLTISVKPRWPLVDRSE